MTKNTQCNKTVKTFLRKELRAYMLVAGELTADEKAALRKWISDGYSCYDNPYALCDESGRSMDFISGCRMTADMLSHPSYYSWAETDYHCCEDEEIPF